MLNAEEKHSGNRSVASKFGIEPIAMKDSDRFRLLGTYKTPRIKLGTVIPCEARDRDLML